MHEIKISEKRGHHFEGDGEYMGRFERSKENREIL